MSIAPASGVMSVINYTQTTAGPATLGAPAQGLDVTDILALLALIASGLALFATCFWEVLKSRQSGINKGIEFSRNQVSDSFARVSLLSEAIQRQANEVVTTGASLDDVQLREKVTKLTRLLESKLEEEHRISEFSRISHELEQNKLGNRELSGCGTCCIQICLDERDIARERRPFLPPNGEKMLDLLAEIKEPTAGHSLFTAILYWGKSSVLAPLVGTNNLELRLKRRAHMVTPLKLSFDGKALTDVLAWHDFELACASRDLALVRNLMAWIPPGEDQRIRGFLTAFLHATDLDIHAYTDTAPFSQYMSDLYDALFNGYTEDQKAVIDRRALAEFGFLDTELPHHKTISTIKPPKSNMKSAIIALKKAYLGRQLYPHI